MDTFTVDAKSFLGVYSKCTLKTLCEKNLRMLTTLSQPTQRDVLINIRTHNVTAAKQEFR